MKNFNKDQGLDQAIKLVGKKYDLLIIDAIIKNKGKTRFNQLINNIPSINPRTLSMRLKKMEENKLLTKNLVFGTPVITEYHLTEKSKALEPILNNLKKWAKS